MYTSFAYLCLTLSRRQKVFCVSYESVETADSYRNIWLPLGSVQPLCNYCSDSLLTHIQHCQVFIVTANWIEAARNGHNFPTFQKLDRNWCSTDHITPQRPILTVWKPRFCSRVFIRTSASCVSDGSVLPLVALLVLIEWANPSSEATWLLSCRLFRIIPSCMRCEHKHLCRI